MWVFASRSLYEMCLPPGSNQKDASERWGGEGSDAGSREDIVEGLRCERRIC